MAQDNYFAGQERLETFPTLQRLMRMGLPEALEVGDRQRIVDAIRGEDADKSLAYLNLISQNHIEMFELLFEWCLAWSQAAEQNISADGERRCTKLAYQRWLAALESLQCDEHARPLLAALRPILSEQSVGPGTAQAFRICKAGGSRTLADGIVNDLLKRRENIGDEIKSHNFNSALELFDAYWSCVVTGHDALVQYSQAYPSATLELHDQALAEKLVHDSFSGCSFFEGLWYLGTHLTAAELAAFLAEHLRIHCSGRERQGAVGIREEVDCYRLILDPCGSGGAMRRRHGPLLTESMALASPGTWNMANTVPCYCSHCAYNELQSMKRMGYPVMVTEFDADPAKPCGWTVYKEPALIPDRYFERLGFKKDTSKFIKPQCK